MFKLFKRIFNFELKNIIKIKYQNLFFSVLGSFSISFSFLYHYLKNTNLVKFVIFLIIIFLNLEIIFIFLRWVYKHIIVFLKSDLLDGLYFYLPLFYFLFSLFFYFLIIPGNFLKFFYILMISIISIIFFVFFLKSYNNKISQAVFYLGIFLVFLYVLNFIFQYLSSVYSISDGLAKRDGIIFLRTCGILAILNISFSFFGIIYWFIAKKYRKIIFFVWQLLFLLFLLFWFVDLQVLHGSGIHIGPMIFEHASGSISFLLQTISVWFILFFIVVIFLFLFIFKKLVKIYNEQTKKFWLFFHILVLLVMPFLVFHLEAFKSLPEVVVTKSFYYKFKKNVFYEEPPEAIFLKLEKFGLHYDLDQFYLVNKDKVYNNEDYLPQVFKSKKPNVVIVFLESFSARLNSVYNNNFANLTPGLKDFSNDKNTTVFKKFYNASTPTGPSMISMLCSHLVTTSHQEIAKHNVFKGHKLDCLPYILLKNDYKFSSYIVSTDKSYAHTEKIFKDMGFNEILGLKELSVFINNKPYSWGYSDHQLFPFVFEKMKKIDNDNKTPFLLMYSTIDTHPPFAQLPDTKKLPNNDINLLNSFHSTDDAFYGFWKKFKDSKFYKNTVLVVVADHAVFPGVEVKKVFPNITDEHFTDEITFMVYVPDSILPHEINILSSGIDFAPTILQILGINVKNSFEGHSILDDRINYPNILSMHDLGLYINQVDKDGNRQIHYISNNYPECSSLKDMFVDKDKPLTLCELYYFYHWKKNQFYSGRFWRKDN